MHASAALGSTLFIHGGRDASYSLCDLWSLQLLLHHEASGDGAFKTSAGHYFLWSSLDSKTMSSGICAHTMVVYNLSLLLYGGIIENSVSNAAWKCSLSPSGEWADLELSSSIPPKFGHSMAILTSQADGSLHQVVIVAGMSLDPEDSSMIILHLSSSMCSKES